MHGFNLLVGGLNHLGVGQGDTGLILLQAGNGGVEGQIAFEEQAVGLALLGNHGKAVLDGLLGAVEVHQPVFEINPARGPGAHAKDGLQQLGTPGAHQTIEAENFSLPHVEGDILEVGGKFGGQVLDGQDGAARGIVHRGEAAFQRAAHHGGNELVHVGVLGALGHDQIAVPQDGNLVADFKNFVHLVGDVNERNTLLLEHPHHLEELIHLLNRQGGRGLIQDDNLGVVGNRFCNFAHLPLGDGHIPHGLVQVDGHAQLAEELGRLLFHAALVHDSHGIGGVAAQKQIVHNVPLQALVQLLMDHGNSVFQGVFRAGKADFLPV